MVCLARVDQGNPVRKREAHALAEEESAEKERQIKRERRGGTGAVPVQGTGGSWTDD